MTASSNAKPGDQLSLAAYAVTLGREYISLTSLRRMLIMPIVLSIWHSSSTSAWADSFMRLQMESISSSLASSNLRLAAACPDTGLSD